MAQLVEPSLPILQKLPKNVGDLDKLIVAKGFKKWLKVQKIAQSGHTAHGIYFLNGTTRPLFRLFSDFSNNHQYNFYNKSM